MNIAGNEVGDKPPSTRSVLEIISSIQRSKTGIEGWSLSDLTIGLYLIYLRQASLNPFEDVKGVKITSDSIVMLTPCIKCFCKEFLIFFRLGMTKSLIKMVL